MYSPMPSCSKTPNLRYIYQVAKEFDFMVVEDASHSPGAFYVDDDGKDARVDHVDGAMLQH